MKGDKVRPGYDPVEVRAAMRQAVDRAKNRQGTTYGEMYARAGLNENTVSKILRGDTKSPELATIMQVAFACQISVSELVGDKLPPPSAAMETVNDEEIDQFFSELRKLLVEQSTGLDGLIFQVSRLMTKRRR